MPRLEHKYKGYYIRLVGDGRFRVVDPYGYATTQFFQTLAQAQQYIDKHGKPIEELISVVFKHKKVWKYACPSQGLLREIQLGDQCVYYVTNRTVYENGFDFEEVWTVGASLPIDDDASLDDWRVSIFEREYLPESSQLGWLEVEILNRSLTNKNQARKFAKKFCQAAGVALARSLLPNILFLDELGESEEEDEGNSGDCQYF